MRLSAAVKNTSSPPASNSSVCSGRLTMLPSAACVVSIATSTPSISSPSLVEIRGWMGFVFHGAASCEFADPTIALGAINAR